MKKAFYLATCDTCRRILKELQLDDSWSLREIKSEPINENELEEMRKLSGSYESLFSRRARKYKELNLGDKVQSEEDIKQLLLEDYTFLKRPVFVFNDRIFAGNAMANIELVKKHLLLS